MYRGVYGVGVCVVILPYFKINMKPIFIICRLKLT